MKRSRINLVLTYGVLVLLTIIIGFPLFWMIISSFKPGPDLFTSPPKIFPNSLTVEWYRNVVLRSQAPQLFQNSFVVATATMIINLAIATPGAYSLTRFKYRGRDLFLYSTLVSYVFPAILLLVPLFLILSSLHLIGTLGGTILSHTIITVPFSVWLMRSFFLSIPVELEEAALVDGCTYLGAFFRIVLPIAAPGALSTGLIAFILSWNEYLFASVVATSVTTKTLPVGIAEFITSFDIRWGEIMALGTITTVPVIIFFMLIQKYFVKGLTAGAIKG
jgi:ABC-type glycerol-3-phosphate transport system permease component